MAIGVFTLLGTKAILIGKVGVILKGLKLAFTAINTLPGAMALIPAATAIKTFAAYSVGSSNSIRCGAAPALFPGTVETETDLP